MRVVLRAGVAPGGGAQPPAERMRRLGLLMLAALAVAPLVGCDSPTAPTARAVRV